MKRYARRNPTIEAAQHDGSDASAIRLEAWINSCAEPGIKATAFLQGTVDYATHAAFVRIDGGRPQNLVGPGSWVVKVDGGSFYAIPDVDFKLLYLPEPVDGESSYC